MTDTHENLKKILVVEDSKDISSLLGEVLEDDGYQVFYAENGHEALKQAKVVRPDLILMDLSLPGLDGWEVVRQLRAKSEFDTTQIIAVTAHATNADRTRAMAIGCTGYISKPFDIEAMLKQVGKLMRSN